MSKKEKVNSEKNVSEQKKETLFIYVGPTTPFITRYTSSINGYPPHLKEHFDKFPILKKLFVTLDQFIEFEQKVKETGTAENMLFEKTKEYFKAVSK